MTQCERILEILGDGDWHEKSEFYGFCVLHSRISDLRARGNVIEYRREGERHLYRLVSLSEPATGDHGASPAGSLSVSGVGVPAVTSSAPTTGDLVRRSAPEQLSVWEAA